MKKCFLLTILVVACASTSFSQARQKETTRTATGVDSAKSINAAEKTTTLQNDTLVAARLQNALDVRKAKVGDRGRSHIRLSNSIDSGTRNFIGSGNMQKSII